VGRAGSLIQEIKPIAQEETTRLEVFHRCLALGDTAQLGWTAVCVRWWVRSPLQDPHTHPLRITECSGLAETSVGHPVQPPCPSRVTQSRLHRTASRWVLNISREGDSTTSLETLPNLSYFPVFFLLSYPHRSRIYLPVLGLLKSRDAQRLPGLSQVPQQP